MCIQIVIRVSKKAENLCTSSPINRLWQGLAILPRLGSLTILVACTKRHDNKGLECNCTIGMNKIENTLEAIFLLYLFKLIQHPTSTILKVPAMACGQMVCLIVEHTSSMLGGHPNMLHRLP